MCIKYGKELQWFFFFIRSLKIIFRLLEKHIPSYYTRERRTLTTRPSFYPFPLLISVYLIRNFGFITTHSFDWRLVCLLTIVFLCARTNSDLFWSKKHICIYKETCTRLNNVKMRELESVETVLHNRQVLLLLTSHIKGVYRFASEIVYICTDNRCLSSYTYRKDRNPYGYKGYKEW